MDRQFTIDIENIIFHLNLDTGRISVTGWVNDRCIEFKSPSISTLYEDLRDAFIMEGGSIEDFFFDHFPKLTGGNCRGYVGVSPYTKSEVKR
jgi:hypothetical protein